MKLLFAAMSLVGALGLSRLQGGAPVEAGAPVAAEEAVRQSVDVQIDDAMSTCPRVWVCEWDGTWHETRQSCIAECNSGCYVEIFCDGSCVCP